MLTGTIVQHYAVGERLGAGGMGEVYRAVDTRLGRPVALKFIKAEHQRDPDRRARLLQEARAASLLRSPSIATTYDIGEHDGTLFIVMELVEGELLADRLRRGPLPIRQAVEMAEQIADALDEAHGQGIVHRDIKSTNLVVTSRGPIKILDFGLAKFTHPGATPEAQPTLAETLAGTLVGTVAYMSPEQALGRRVDQRSDLFSLGVVLYETLAGRRPFDGPTMPAVIDSILHNEPTALARLNYDITPQIDSIVRKLMAKDMDYRYQSAREVVIDLRAARLALEGTPGSSTSPHHYGGPLASALRQAQGVLSPSKHARDAGAAVTPRNAVAVLPFSNITREPADEWIGSGIAETVTADLKNIHGLSVIGRERVFDAVRELGAGIGRLDDHLIIDAGRRLRSTWLVTGGYQRIGHLIRITARFVEVESGTVIRTVKIDGGIDEIFTLQDKIVYELSQGLNLTLHDSEVAEIERKETASVEAYENRSRAIMNLLEASPQSLDRAIYLLENATTADPHYAAAWTALGAAYDLKGSFLGLRELSHRAIEIERRAIALNPRLAEAHRWLGLSLMSLGRYEEAIAAITEALGLEPGDAASHSALGRAYWVGQGKLHEGIAELERALTINPEIGWAYLQLALLYALVGEYAKAEAASNKAIAFQQRYASGREGLRIVGGYTRLGYVYYRQGRYQEALEMYERQLQWLASSDHALKERGLIELNQKIGATYVRLGRMDDAQRHFERAVEDFEGRLGRGADDPFTTYYIALVYGLRGDADRAVRYLRQTFELLPALNRVRAQIDPDFDSIRHDPRFVALLTPPPGVTSSAVSYASPAENALS